MIDPFDRDFPQKVRRKSEAILQAKLNTKSMYVWNCSS